MKITRRGVLASIAATAACGSVQGAAKAAAGPAPEQDANAPKSGAHRIVPLPFDPAKLTGISERMILSHHGNNYAGAVKNLNKIELDIAAATKETPGYALGGLKERELTFRNSAVFHEHYFANLGGDGRATGPVQSTIAAAFGTFAKFEESFRAIGLSLGGGSGWAVLGHDLDRDALYVSWSGNHTQAAASTVPLLVMDMYEHAYHMDFGSAAAKYVDVFFANIRWEEVARRHARSAKAAAALKG